MNVQLFDNVPATDCAPTVNLRLRNWPALGLTRIELIGELDAGSCTDLEAASDRVFEDGWDVELDLSALTFADLAGLTTIASLRGRGASRQRAVSVINPSPSIKRLAGLLAGLDHPTAVRIAAEILGAPIPSSSAR
jgi:anti-anti-sigma regulatory factor